MKKQLQITVLGSGTSTGVPLVGCDCSVCKSSDSFNKRFRSSLHINYLPYDINILIDTGPDLRSQLLAADVSKIDHVLYTHTHADHCHGFDDLRVLYFRHKKPIQAWGIKSHLEEIRQKFSYAFCQTGYQGAKPQVSLNTLPDQGSFTIEDLDIEFFSFPHGHMLSTGFRFGSFAYLTDFKTFPEECMKNWQGKIETMVISGLRFTTHPSHSHIEQSIQYLKELQVKQGYLTHLTHDIDYHRDSKELPEGVNFAYDGLSFVVDL